MWEQYSTQIILMAFAPGGSVFHFELPSYRDDERGDRTLATGDSALTPSRADEVNE